MNDNEVLQCLRFAEKNGFNWRDFVERYMNDFDEPRKFISVPCFKSKLFTNDDFLKCIFDSTITKDKKKDFYKLESLILKKVQKTGVKTVFPEQSKKKKQGRPKGSKNKKKRS